MVQEIRSLQKLAIFSGSHVGGGGGGGACTRYFTVYSKDLNVYLFLYDNFISNFLIFLISGPHTLLMVMVCVLNNFVVCDYS